MLGVFEIRRCNGFPREVESESDGVGPYVIWTGRVDGRWGIGLRHLACAPPRVFLRLGLMVHVEDVLYFMLLCLVVVFTCDG